MSVDVNDPRPPYQQVADDLRRKIQAGEYAPGARIPSLRQLATTYGLSQQTIQSAMRELRQDGLVVSQQGRAAYVRDAAKPIQRPVPDLAEIAKRLEAVEHEVRELRSRVENPAAGQ